MTRYLEQRVEEVERVVERHLRYHRKHDHGDHDEDDGDNDRCCKQLRARLEGLAGSVAEIREVLDAGIIRRRMHVGAFAEEPRGTLSQGGLSMQIHSGKQGRAPLNAADIDGVPVDASGAIVTSADETQVTAHLEPNSSGGVDLVCVDVPNSNLGAVDVTVTLGNATLVVPVEVVAGDAAVANLGAVTEEDRP